MSKHIPRASYLAKQQKRADPLKFIAVPDLNVSTEGDDPLQELLISKRNELSKFDIILAAEKSPRDLPSEIQGWITDIVGVL